MSQASQALIDAHVERQAFCQLVGMVAERLERLGRFLKLVNEPLMVEPDPGLLIYEMIYSAATPGTEGRFEEKKVCQKFLILEFPSGYHAPTENEEPVHLTVAVSGHHVVQNQPFDITSLLSEGIHKNYGRLTLRGHPITWDELPKGVLRSWNDHLREQVAELEIEVRGKDPQRVSSRYRELSERIEELATKSQEDPRVNLLEMLAPALEDFISTPFRHETSQRLQRSLLRVVTDLIEKS